MRLPSASSTVCRGAEGARSAEAGKPSFIGFRLFPQRIHFGERNVKRCFAPRRKRAFDGGKAALEFLVGLPQQRLGISVQVTGEVDGSKKQVADFGGGFIWVGFQRRLDLIGLLANLAQYGAHVVPVEPYFAGFGLELKRAGERGEGDRYSGQAALLRRLACSCLRSFPFLLLRLYCLPQAFDSLGVGGATLAENVRMPADKFRGDGLDYVAEVERALFLRHARVEDHLEEEIA